MLYHSYQCMLCRCSVHGLHSQGQVTMAERILWTYFCVIANADINMKCKVRLFYIHSLFMINFCTHGVSACDVCLCVCVCVEGGQTSFPLKHYPLQMMERKRARLNNCILFSLPLLSPSPEFSLCLLKGVGEGCVLGGVTNHIKAFKLHLLKDQREFLAEGP